MDMWIGVYVYVYDRLCMLVYMYSLESHCVFIPGECRGRSEENVFPEAWERDYVHV